MKKVFIAKFANPKVLIMLIIASLLFVASDSVLAAKKKGKKPTGTMMGPTGILGNYQPKWPKTPKEITVTYIEEGSPSSGSDLKVGDVIVGFGNEKFKRHAFWDQAEAIEKTEASGGKLTLLLKSGKQVDIKLANLGPYSATAPYNCPKTDKIITQAADALLKKGIGSSVTRTELLGLMATGEKKYIDAVAEKMQEVAKVDPKKVDAYLKGETSDLGSTGWTWGYNLIALGEYYLLTKDETVLPAIRTYALGLARGQDGVGCYGHRMARGPKRRAPGYGTMNQPSITNLMGMLIAQKCGIKDSVLDKAVERSYATVKNVVGKGGFAYGSGGNYPNFYNNNGTSGSAAICMSLNGNQKGASYFSQCAATAYDSLTSGHASSFFNPLWTPVGSSISGPEVTQQFFKKSLWYFTGQRHWKDGFPKADKAGAVAGQALLMYCIPRKALLITGREADESIYLKGDEATKAIMRSKIDYKKKSVDELLAMFDDPFIQVRLNAQKELSKRAGNGKKTDTVTPKALALMQDGNEQTKISVLSYLGQCHKDVAPKHTEWIGKVLRNKEESLNVRVAAASALGSRSFGEGALPFYNDILKLVLENTEPDPFGTIDGKLGKALQSISNNSKTKPLDEKCKADKELLYKVANRFLDHKRQKTRQAGTAMLVGITKEDFPIVAEKLVYVLDDKDPGYHTYSSVINVPAINILADFNIKEGLDLLEYGIFHGGGKWGFKYRALMKTLPLYGANAKPYIPKFEAHKDINKPGDRFTPSWQKMVKQINEDKNPKKLITIEEVLKAAGKE